MAVTLYQIRGRQIAADDLHAIRATISDHWASGRSAISRLLCERWDWRQPNGQLKEMACRALLLSLEAKGALELPPRQKESFRAPRRTDRQVFVVDDSPLGGTVAAFRSLTIRMVRQTPDEALWDYLVDTHHYLGRPWIVGACLKYLAYLDGRLVACLGWGSAAWKVACRDGVIGWDRESRETNLHKVVNNVRFLILPWVRVEHLASKVLAANLRVLASDWQRFYSQEMADLPVMSREALMELSKERLVDIILFQAEIIARQAETIARLEKRIEDLEARLNANSSNSNQPPSSDSPYKKPIKQPGKNGRPGAKKGHKYIELPKIEVAVTHFVLLKGACTGCGKINKARVPSEYRSGYGPRMSAVIAELAGSHGDSRSTIQNFCASVLGFSISLGTIQKVLDRASEAIKPHYDAIGDEARKQAVNHADETSWPLKGALCWLWVLASASVAFFMIHRNRSKAAFKELVKDWEGILVSDGYRLYTDWVGLRQTCLAHLIREAKKLSESKNVEIAKFGASALAELRRLCHMAHAPPTIGEWRAFYARFIKLITRHHGRKDEAGRFAARLLREVDSLWLFLEKGGVSPTNNHAERMLRFAVCWRKRSYGSVTEKGHRWAERILSLRQTCRLRTKRTFPVLVEAIDSYFKEQKPDLAWIAQM